MSELGPYMPHQELPSDMVFREARIIVGQEAILARSEAEERFRLHNEAVCLSVDRVLSEPDIAGIGIAGHVNSVFTDLASRRVRESRNAKAASIMIFAAGSLAASCIINLYDCFTGNSSRKTR